MGLASLTATASPRSWAEICDDPYLAQLPYRIETDRWGNLVMSPPPRSRHAEYQGEIVHLLRSWMKHGRSLPECPLQTSEGVKVIDVVWVSEARRKSRTNDPCYVIAPEICIEVVSPSNTADEFAERRRLFFERGALEVWGCDQDGRLTFFDPAGPVDRSQLCPQFPAKLEID
jgi:Uma2 family endonuclease